MARTREQFIKDFWNSATGQRSWRYRPEADGVAERIVEDMTARGERLAYTRLDWRLRSYFIAKEHGRVCTGWNFGRGYRDGEQRCARAGQHKCRYCGEWRCDAHMELPDMCSTRRHS